MAAQRVNSREISEILNDAKSVAIFGHVNPDGDCFGSVFGMKLALKSAGKGVFAYLDKKVPDNLKFLSEYGDLGVENDIKPDDVVIVFDSSQVNRVEREELLREYKEKGVPIYQIDHHIQGDLSDLADYSWQDDRKSSVSEMALDIIKKMDIRIKKDVATLLLAGIGGDTGSFQHQNTTQNSFEAAGYLISKGARYKAIADNILNPKNELNILRLYGLVLERLIYNKKYQIVVSYLTCEDLKKFGVEGESFSEVANLLNVIDGAKAIILITERENGILKVSLRTRDKHVDVQKLASYVGGGGHIKASGFTVRGRILVENGQIKVV